MRFSIQSSYSKNAFLPQKLMIASAQRAILVEILMTSHREINVGTRGSPLALAQTNLVINQLKNLYPHLIFTIKPISTSGDQILDRPLYDIGGKGLFSKEIELALSRKEIDFSVHSLKDMESSLPNDLIIAAVLPRENPADALIAKDNIDFWSLPEKAKVGTCSPRRTAQLLHHRPDLEIVMIRGNIQTRLHKLTDENLDAVVMAYAGLKRINCLDHISMIFPYDLMLPAVGQGTIAAECRKDDVEMISLLQSINNPETWQCSLAERSLLHILDGNCRTPIAGYATITGTGELCLEGMIASPEGKYVIYQKLMGEDPETLGQQVAENLKKEMHFKIHA